MRFFTILVSTFFYIGYFPLAPGSMATLLTVGICYSLRSHGGIQIVLFLLVTVLGYLLSGRMEKIAGKKDPSCVVIDEVAGCFIAFFLLPLTPAVMWSTFFLFRAFDMFKIYPANKFEKLKGGVGIMSDDVVAGVYTNLIMQVALRITPIN